MGTQVREKQAVTVQKSPSRIEKKENTEVVPYKGTKNEL
jgi:hypothetical protein